MTNVWTGISRKDALTYTRNVWLWVAENPKEDKINWPGWKTYPTKGNPELYIDFINECPLCDYVRRGPCSDCPLFEKWLPDRTREVAPCCFPGSPFDTYCGSDSKRTIRRAALTIARWCQEELDKEEQND